ncbi:hypothetical protein BGZ57DRAFT_955390 [Hyaloscypha finlandica]|nr:hypothetical protein BGZ57DRAFT_955390 [Hyaloscypha finlandica]
MTSFATHIHCEREEIEASNSPSGSGPIRPFNIASGPGGNWDGFVTDFAA